MSKLATQNMCWIKAILINHYWINNPNGKAWCVVVVVQEVCDSVWTVGKAVVYGKVLTLIIIICVFSWAENVFIIN